MSDHFLSSGQVAEYLGMTRDALMHQIRSGEFLEPDVVVGDRGIQGWSVGRVEQLRQERLGGAVQCDPGRVVTLINEVRAIAEIVRAYGDRSSLAATTLHVAAAEMESDVRSLISIDVGFRRTVAGDDFGCGAGDPVLVPIQVQAVDVISAPLEVDGVTRVGELIGAVRRLDEVIRLLPEVYAASGGRRAGYALTVQRGEIVEQVRSLKIADPGLRQAVLADAVKVAVGAVTAAGRIKGLGEGERAELQEIVVRAERAVGEIDSFLTGFTTVSGPPDDAATRAAGASLAMAYHGLLSDVTYTQALVESHSAAQSWGAYDRRLIAEEIDPVRYALLDGMARLGDAWEAWSELLPGV